MRIGRFAHCVRDPLAVHPCVPGLPDRACTLAPVGPVRALPGQLVEAPLVAVDVPAHVGVPIHALPVRLVDTDLLQNNT